MNGAFTKTLSLLILIAIGYLFQKKIHSKEQREGIRIVILSLALPATILIALLQIKFAPGLLIIPALSLGFNGAMYLLIAKLPVQSLWKLPASQYRTLVMLVPSLAPGLSCFPFIMEYSGQSALAMAALADVGNKIFVLIISYTIAMKWYYDVNRKQLQNGNIRGILMALFGEPVNVVMVIAVVMIALGLTFQSIPEFIGLSIDRLSLLMTPLILVFIGLSMKLTWEQAKTIFSFLFFRSGVAFAISGAALYFFPVADLPTALLLIVFPQSACSFWPYAHMAMVRKMESRYPGENTMKTFDPDFGMNVLACSMPFSVVLIMMIYASGDFFIHPATVFGGAAGFVTVAGILVMFKSRVFSGPPLPTNLWPGWTDATDRS
jgi:hypothetical protein